MIETNNFNVVKKLALNKGEFSVECNIPSVDSLSKVLTTHASVSVAQSEVINGCVNFGGNIDAKLVYLTDDGEIGTIASVCPFTSKFEGDVILSGQKAIINLKIVDVSVESANSDNVRVNVSLVQTGEVVSNVEVPTIAANDSDICTKTEVIKVNRFVGQAQEEINVKSELSTRGNVKKLLLTESQVWVKSVEPGVNFAAVSGEVVTRVLYLNNEDKFENSYIYESFKEEVELDGVTRESQVEASAYVKCDGVKTAIEESDKGTKIMVEVPVVLALKAYEETEVTVIKDLYSVCNEIKVETSSFDMSVVCPQEIIESKIDGSLTLEEDKPRVDKILFVGGNNVSVSNSYIKDGEICIEGIASTTCVYLNDELGSLNSVQIDVPFVIVEKFNDENVDGLLNVDAIICDVDVTVRKGRELYFDAKVKATVNYCKPIVSGVISKAEISEAYADKDYGMELVFARANQDAWEIAKEARVKEEMLVMQNPEVVFPLQEDKYLILFYQKIQ